MMEFKINRKWNKMNDPENPFSDIHIPDSAWEGTITYLCNRRAPDLPVYVVERGDRQTATCAGCVREWDRRKAQMVPNLQLYEFYDAPNELRNLSRHGGDEDGVIVVAAGYEMPYWIVRLWEVFGEGAVQIEKLADGRTVYIWAHA